MRTINVLTNPNYFVFIGDVNDELASSINNNRKVLVVSDSNVEKLHLDSFIKELNRDVLTYCFEAGEERKNFDTYKSILDILIKNNFTRNDLIIGFGGGVVGDITGFVASTYQRGIDYILVPTTLLSMIDSCVGGKCGINYNGLKNYVGSFYQPSSVYVNLKYLATLDENGILNGFGEGLKYFALIGEDLIIPNELDEDGMEEFVYNCLSYKAKVVESDERDSFNRKLLNLGHTLAHAIEEVSNYEISHGIAVANGVYMMAKASNLNHKLSKESLAKIENIINCFNMPLCQFESEEEIKKYISKDKKKVTDEDIDVVVISELGQCDIARMDIDSFVKYISKSALN